MKNLVLLASLIAGCAIVQGGSGLEATDCTSIGCVDGLTIQFERNEAWMAGTWQFEFVVDGETVLCDVEMPFSESPTGCSDPDILLTLSGTLLPPDQQEIPEVLFTDTPDQLTIVVRHDDTELSRKEFTPEYTVSRPNGPGCEPECKQASDSMQIP